MSNPTSTSKGNTAFFYGTLMSRKVLTRVIYGTTTPEGWQCAHLRIRPAILHDFCRRRIRFADYPGIIQERGASVRGTYVEGLTDGDIWRLDRFEGGEYSREKVTVRLLEGSPEKEGEEFQAETYVYVAPESHLENSEWDYDHFVKENLWKWCGEDSKEFDGNVDQLDGAGDHDSTGGRQSFVSELTEEERNAWRQELEHRVQAKADEIV